MTAVSEIIVKTIEENVSNDEIKLKARLIEGVRKIIKEYEEEIEDELLSQKYQSRLDLPEDQWLERPKGMSIGEWFKSMHTEGESKDEK